MLGIPWLATASAYIGCQTRSMTISKGPTISNIILYPPARPNMLTNDFICSPHKYQEGNLRSPLTINRALIFKRHTKDDIINGFINQPSTIENPTYQMLKVVLHNEAQ